MTAKQEPREYAPLQPHLCDYCAAIKEYRRNLSSDLRRSIVNIGEVVLHKPNSFGAFRSKHQGCAAARYYVAHNRRIMRERELVNG